MLRFWHVSLLVLIALIWKVRSTYSAVDVCDLSGVRGVYCNCQPAPSNKLEITCFILRTNLTAAGEIWDSFHRVRNTVALSLHSRNPAQLTSIPKEALKHLDVLETLTIQEGNLGELKKGALTNLPTLFTLKLERNEITSLNRHSISNLPNLKKLTLSENALSEILADTFSELDELENLYLDRNNISRIENCGFCTLQNLRELDLSTNVLRDLTEHVFRGLRYVTRLDLSYNQIRVLNEKVFQAMPRLVDLNLEENLIAFISPRAFYGLNELRILNLSHNKLKMLPDNVFRPLPDLLTLYLSHNELNTLQEEVIESLHNALKDHFVVTLQENKLKCGCELAWIKRYHAKVKNSYFARGLQRMKCQSEDGEVMAHELEFRDCDKTSKKDKTVSLMNPTLSTLGSNRDAVQINPKYESEYSDSASSINHTAQKTEVVDVAHNDNNVAHDNVAHDGNNVANAVSINIALLLGMVVQTVFNLRKF